MSTGTNICVGRDMQRLRDEATCAFTGDTDLRLVQLYWDGKAGERIGRVVTAASKSR